MSALADAPTQQIEKKDTGNGNDKANGKQKQPMSPLRKGLYAVGGVWLLGIIFLALVTGLKSHKAASVAGSNPAFSPTDEFKLDTWFSLGPIDFNKGVLYLLLTVGITLGIMIYVSRRMQRRPGRLQTAVEWFYSFSDDLARGNLDEGMTKKYFPLIATIFVFILVTNLIGYIPLPVDSTEKFHIFGALIPSFQIYAADTNVALPLILALGVFVLFNYEGIKAHHGLRGYLKSLMPGGVKGPIVGLIFPIEIMSTFLRLVSLTVRLWANLLAGHLLIAFMGGELGVLVGLPVISWALLPFGIAIFLFEAVLIAGLQAFIFAILTAIYLGSAVQSH